MAPVCHDVSINVLQNNSRSMDKLYT